MSAFYCHACSKEVSILLASISSSDEPACPLCESTIVEQLGQGGLEEFRHAAEPAAAPIGLGTPTTLPQATPSSSSSSSSAAHHPQHERSRREENEDVEEEEEEEEEEEADVNFADHLLSGAFAVQGPGAEDHSQPRTGLGVFGSGPVAAELDEMLLRVLFPTVLPPRRQRAGGYAPSQQRYQHMIPVPLSLLLGAAMHETGMSHAAAGAGSAAGSQLRWLLDGGAAAERDAPSPHSMDMQELLNHILMNEQSYSDAPTPVSPEALQQCTATHRLVSTEVLERVCGSGRRVRKSGQRGGSSSAEAAPAPPASAAPTSDFLPDCSPAEPAAAAAEGAGAAPRTDHQGGLGIRSSSSSANLAEAALPSVVVGTCPITQEEFTVGDEATEVFCCGSVFQYEALMQWLGKRNSCPVCRTLMLSAEERGRERERDG